jgi:hypothetical protein
MIALALVSSDFSPPCLIGVSFTFSGGTDVWRFYVVLSENYCIGLLVLVDETFIVPGPP